jgi:hypothetical protein
MTSVGEVTAGVGRGRIFFFVRPAGIRTGNLSLMRRVWYHKTTASAILDDAWFVTNSRQIAANLAEFATGLYHAISRNAPTEVFERFDEHAS